MSGPTRAVITGAGQACPPSRSQEELWESFFGQHFANGKQDRWFKRAFFSTGVRHRHCAVDPTSEDLSAWSTGRRMARYVDEAVPLAARAVEGALEAAGVVAGDVGLLTVVSCTGYATPGVDIRLAADLGFADSVQRLLIGHMGCYGALPGLGAVSDHVVARGRPAVLLCVELASLHIQPPTDDLEQVVAHSLFSDAAAAVVMEPGSSAGGDGWEVVDVVARTDVSTAALMTWDVTDLGFRMGLSRKVPDVLAVHVAPLVEDLLVRNGIGVDDVEAWAVHPGGPRILDVIADRLHLADDALAASHLVLAQHGNCSSATTLLVLDEIRRRPLRAGSHVVTLAFGPGLTLYGVLLRVRGTLR
ncbi:MAG: type III polyketide synthase [Actinomycetota bacterium]|nr:type III polyketide synthase [Actinomycetota bacterium]